MSTYVYPESVLGMSVTFIVTSIAAVATRFGTRLGKGIELGLDDWFALGALPLVIGSCCTMIIGYATHTIGSHSPDIGMAVFTAHLSSQSLEKKLEFAFYLLQMPALLCLKLSMLFFYRRLFISKKFQVIFWILTVVTILWTLSFWIAWASLCKHFDDRFISLMTWATKCADSFVAMTVQAVTDVVVDLAILVLPIPFILNLQMPLKRKLAVLCMLLVGGLAVACGMARTIIYGEIFGTPLLSKPIIAGEKSTDFLGVVSLSLFWATLELGVGMVAVCLPTLRPLFRDASLESMVRSLRSFVSLPSFTSLSRQPRGDSSDGFTEIKGNPWQHSSSGNFQSDVSRTAVIEKAVVNGV